MRHCEERLADVAGRLIEAGASVNLQVNLQAKRFGSPLHPAAQSGSVDVARRLIEAGASVNLQTEVYGRAPLHLAAILGHVDVAGRLIEAGASVNLQGEVRRAGRDGQRGRVWLQRRGDGGAVLFVFCRQ